MMIRIDQKELIKKIVSSIKKNTKLYSIIDENNCPNTIISFTGNDIIFFEGFFDNYSITIFNGFEDIVINIKNVYYNEEDAIKEYKYYFDTIYQYINNYNERSENKITLNLDLKITIKDCKEYKKGGV
jgi:hypothetical protein